MNLASNTAPLPATMPVQGRPHPPEYRMPQPMLDAFDCLPGIAFVPMAVEGFGHKAELDDEVAGQVLRLGLAPFLLPQADQGCFIAAHDDPGIRAAYKVPAARMMFVHVFAPEPKLVHCTPALRHTVGTMSTSICTEYQ
jgi:hypothetical protein